MQDLLFAFTVGKHVKSNAIVYVKNGMTVGVGAGQMSRVNSPGLLEAAAVSCCRGTSWAKGSVVIGCFFHLQMAFWPRRKPAPAVIQPEDLSGR